MDHGNSFVIVDHSDLQGLAGSGWADEHGDSGIVGVEGPPVMSECVQHVLVWDVVAARAWLDVHTLIL